MHLNNNRDELDDQILELEDRRNRVSRTITQKRRLLFEQAPTFGFELTRRLEIRDLNQPIQPRLIQPPIIQLPRFQQLPIQPQRFQQPTIQHSKVETPTVKPSTSNSSTSNLSTFDADEEFDFEIIEILNKTRTTKEKSNIDLSIVKVEQDSDDDED